MKKYDVLCVGNAIVDIIAFCDDDFLVENSIIKSSMNLIDRERSRYLQSKMNESVTQTSGGSAANTAAGIAALGGRASFVGKVAKDVYGDFYSHDIRSCGVAFNASPLESPPETACCMIFVTPDCERSMNTYLGACTKLNINDFDAVKEETASIVFFEGYLWDTPSACDLVHLICDHAHKNGNKVAITLSDAACVDRHRNAFLNLIQSKKVDIIFSNTHEIKTLYQTSSLDAAIEMVRKDCPLSIITRSEKGSVLVEGDDTVFIDAMNVPEVIDTTGAGDLYAAGFLFGYTQGKTIKTCGCIGSFLAGLIIQKIGSRLSVDPKKLLMTMDFMNQE